LGILYIVGVKQRIYIDTSVVGGHFDDEFSIDTILFFERVRNGEISILVSDLLEAELLGAPVFVRELLTTIPANNIENVRLTLEATELANKYIEAKVVGKTSKADCQHIAIATLNKADVLVSWNFKHIVNLDRIRGYNGINYQNGHNMIEIRTPKEITKHETDE
jgi:predicted nucleic acid-binding protein